MRRVSCALALAALAACSSEEPTLLRVDVTPAAPVIITGATRTFTATAVYSDGAANDVTGFATWSSGTPEVLSVSDDAGTKGVAHALQAGSARVTAAYEGVSGFTDAEVADHGALSSIAVGPAAPATYVGGTVALVATGTYEDGFTADVTTTATWSSGNEGVATVSDAIADKGKVTGQGGGTATITAAVGSVQGSITVDVSATVSSIDVAPHAPIVVTGTTRTFTATATYSNDVTRVVTELATWSSGAPDVLSVSDVAGTKGVAQGLKVGTARVTAEFGGASGFTDATVADHGALSSIAVGPAAPATYVGGTVNLVATGTFEDGFTADVTTTATWSSGDEGVATVSDAIADKGKVTGQGGGTAAITATVGAVQGSVTVNVSATVSSVAVTPVSPVIKKGTSRAFTATATYSNGVTRIVTELASWTSGAPTILSVSNDAGTKGVAQALQVGSARVTAEFGGASGFSDATVTEHGALVSITVGPGTPVTFVGGTVALVATATYEDTATGDVTAAATWSSGDESVATVSNVPTEQGTVTGQAAGQATITATMGSVHGSATVDVSATVSSVAVTPASPIIMTGTNKQLTATATYSNGATRNATELATWSSEKPTVLSVSDQSGTKGLAHALLAGTSKVTAQFGGASGYTNATVADAGALISVVVGPAGSTAVVGGSVALWALGNYEDGSAQVLTGTATWSSSSESVATVSNTAPDKGKVTGVAAGPATITAAVGSAQGSLPITVNAFSILTVRVEPALVTMSAGGTASVRAFARDASGAEIEVTSLAGWTSGATTIATVASGGIVTGVSQGQTDVSASYSGKTGTTNVVVESAHLVALRLSSPPSVSVGVGFTSEVQAFGLYSDGWEREVTQLATWASDSTAIVRVSNAFGSKGAVAAGVAGTANVTASYGGMTATTAFTVTSRQVQWVMVDAVPSPLPVGVSLQLHATATYDDFTTQDVTSSATWSSPGAAVTVSTSGLATTQDAGTATVTASYGGCSGYTLFTVVGSAPTSLVVSLGRSTMWQGTSTQATTKLLYPDGLAWDVSESAPLVSTNTTVASVSSQTVLALSAGTASIQASYAGLSGSATLTVSAITGLSIDAPAEIPRGATVSAIARATVSGGNAVVVTGSAEWSSSNTSVISVTNTAPKGLLTGVGASGTATITVSLGGFQATKAVTVRGRVLSIAISPETANVAEGSVMALTATATLEDGTLDVTTSASWSSDVYTSVWGGMVYGDHPGTSIVSAGMGGAAGYALVTVLPKAPLQVDIVPFLPDPVRLPVGATVRFSANAQYKGYTLKAPSGVTWYSDNATVASFSSQAGHEGELTINAKGTTFIVATYGGVYSLDRTIAGDDLVSVAAPLATTNVDAGGSETLALTATFSGGTSDVSPLLTWTTDNADVAVVDRGVLYGMRTGSATVQTSFGGSSYSTAVTVGLPTVTGVGVDSATPLAVGATAPLQAVADLSNGDFITVTDVAALSTTTPGILHVTGTSVTADAVGDGTVKAVYASLAGTKTVSVVASVPWLLVDPIEVRATVGQVVCPYVTTAGASAAAQNVTDYAAYTTSNAAVAPLSGACVTATALGTSLVTGTYGGKSASMLVVVEPVEAAPEIVAVADHDAPIHVFERARYDAVASPQTEPVTSAATWTSGATGVAKVVDEGVVEGVAPGWATVTVSIGGFSTPFWVRVLPATLDSIQLQRWAIAVPVGASYPLTVTATYSDGVSGIDVTGAATFTSEGTGVAAFNGPVPNVLHAIAAGVTHVNAQVGTKTVQIPVTVF